jgi:hypothetical protein
VASPITGRRRGSSTAPRGCARAGRGAAPAAAGGPGAGRRQHCGHLRSASSEGEHEPINDATTGHGIGTLAIGTAVSLALSAGAPAVGVDSASHAVERLARAVGVGVSDAQASPPDRSDKRLKRAIEQTRGALTLLHGFHSHDDRSAGRGGSR